MAWDDTPPTKAELGARWDETPPTAQELAGKSSPSDTAWTPSNSWDEYKQKGVDTIGALGKLSGLLRNETTGPATAALIQAATGKKVADIGAGMKASADPTNLKQFPSNTEMFQKAGIPNPSLSDALPDWVYQKPNKNNPWWWLEKGGRLDPSLAGTLQVATDPAMYLGIGEAGEGTQIIKRATQGPIGRAAETVNTINPAKYVAMGVDKAVQGAQGLPGVGQYIPNAATMTNPLSALLSRGLAKPMYRSAVLPVEHEGERFGKRGVADTIYATGAKTPREIIPKASDAADALMKERTHMFAQTPGTVDIPAALQPGYAQVQELMNIGSKESIAEAESLKAELDSVRDRHAGTEGTPGSPGTPDATVQDTSLSADTPIYRGKHPENGKGRWTTDPKLAAIHAGPDGRIQVSSLGNIPPEIVEPGQYAGLFQGTPNIETKLGSKMPRQTVPASQFQLTEPGIPRQVPGEPPTPGTPGLPARPFDRSDATDLKSFWSKKLKNNTHSVTGTTPVADIGKSRATGQLTQEIENAVPEEADALHDINQKYGQVAGTKKSQFIVQTKHDKAASDLMAGTGTDTAMAGMGLAMGGPVGLLAALGGKKAAQAVLLGQMTSGYALRKLSDSGMLDRLNELAQQKKQVQGGR